MKDKQITFPQDFVLMNGVKADDEKIQKWIDESIYNAKIVLAATGQKQYHTAISTGNTKVFIEFYRESDGKYSVFVNVVRDYFISKQYSIEA